MCVVLVLHSTDDVIAPRVERTVCVGGLCSVGTITAVRNSAHNYRFEEQDRRVAALGLLCCHFRTECAVALMIMYLYTCSSCTRSEVRFTPGVDA